MSLGTTCSLWSRHASLLRLMVTPDPGYAILYSLLVSANIQDLLLHYQINSSNLSDNVR